LDPGLKFTGLDKKASTTRIMSMLDNNEVDVKVHLVNTDALCFEPVFICYSEDTVNVKTMDDIKKMNDNNIILVIRGQHRTTF
jgi:hypothetical protein